jgi:LPXTG-motif cell wall-anchored protein
MYILRLMGGFRSFWVGLVALILMVFAGSGFAQNVTVSARLDTASMLIGDHVGMKLQFTGPVNARVIWPFIPDTMLSSLQVIGRGKIDTTISASAPKTLTLAQEINLTCYDSGFYPIPEIGFQYRIPPDTTLHTIHAEMMTLIVHTVKVDTTQAIKPIKGPMKIPITFREVLPWLLLGLAAALLIAGGIWYWRKRKKNEPVFTLKPRVKLLPHEVALTEMEKLRIKKLWQSGKIKEYHSELTEILRRYIEERFKVPALEQTSAEIMESLSEHGCCETNTIGRLSQVLLLADMVKFAKALPGAAENEKSLTEAVEFVYETTEVKS